MEFQSLEDLPAISDTIEAKGATIYDLDMENLGDDTVSPAAIFTLKLSHANTSHSEMLSSVAELSCVRSVQELIS